jgi:hypothetical protein
MFIERSDNVSAELDAENQEASEKVAITLPGTVEKIIKPVDPREPEKAQIAVDGADDLYREIRVENKLQDATGNEVHLKRGAHVEVTIEAVPDEAVEKPANLKK